MEVLEPSEFLAEAQALAVGEKRKVRHLCGDASLVVYNNVDSWTGWCWRCHARGWVPKPQPSMAERLQRQRQQEAIDNALRSDVQAPRPANHDFGTWPLAARLWLLKAGLTPALVKELGAYYHAGSDRVVLPVYGSHRGSIQPDGDESLLRPVVFWQARNCNYPEDGRPKYISQSSNRSGVHCIFPPSDGETVRTHRGDTVVLTEDILSAFKVGASGAATGYSGMGTVLAPHTLSLLIERATPVLLWFDPDPAGLRASKAIARQLRFVGIEVRNIHTDKDPKCYCLREIREILCDYQTQTD